MSDFTVMAELRQVIPTYGRGKRLTWSWFIDDKIAPNELAVLAKHEKNGPAYLYFCTDYCDRIQMS